MNIRTPAISHSRLLIKARTLSEQLTTDVLLSRLDQEVLELLSVSQARAFETLPLVINSDHSITLVMCKQPDLEKRRELEFLLDRKIEIEFAPRDILFRAIELAYAPSTAKLKRAVSRLDEGVDLGDVEGESPIVEFIHTMLRHGCERGASDIHIIPTETGTTVCLRIHGQLFSHPNPFGSNLANERLVRRLKVLAGMDQSTKGPADGEFHYRDGLYRYQVRFSSLVTYWGERVTLRLHDLEKAEQTLEELGLTGPVVKALHSFCIERASLCLVVGPTGSGKTTTMYSLLRHFRDIGRHVITLEDPVEYPVEGVSQSPVNRGGKDGYSDMLKRALRHDPDVLMLGEIRDWETALAVRDAALSGHHVISTIHSGSVLQTFQRLKNFGFCTEEIVEFLGVVHYQELVFEPCVRCGEAADSVSSLGSCIRCGETGPRTRSPFVNLAKGFSMENGLNRLGRISGKDIFAEHISWITSSGEKQKNRIPI